MFEGDAEMWLLLLTAGLVLQSLTLLDRIVLFGVAGRDFPAVDAEFEDLYRGRIIG